jgi:hypothetical protein
MTNKVAWLSITLTLILPVISAQAQSPAQINALLRKSKFVDAGREVNTVLGSGQATISTFCHPQATDQDCKVTALLMMKELRQHYKNIHRIRVVFYDPANIQSYRDVEIRESDVAQVDMGKPLQTVLSQISVAKRTANTARGKTSPRAAGAGQGRSGSSAQVAYETFQSANGEFSVLYPSNWRVSAEGGVLFKVYTSRKDGNASLALLRVAFPWGPTCEDLANAREAEYVQKFANYKKRVHRAQNCNGVPGVYVEGGAPFLNSEVVDRSLFLKSPKAYYTLQMQSTGMDDRELGSIFNTVMNSLRING